MTQTNPTPNTNSRATASIVIGICSIFAGWILIAPLIGLWLGTTARPRSAWGIALNAIMLSGWVVLMLIGAIGVSLYGWNLTR